MTVLQSDGHKAELKADEIEDVKPSKVSTMPEGLANRLTLEQIADLFAYLMNRAGAERGWSRSGQSAVSALRITS